MAAPSWLKKMPQTSSLAAARLLGTEALGQGTSRLLQVSAAGIPFPSLLGHMGTFPSLPACPGESRDHT